jgi:hypothetical protein
MARYVDAIDLPIPIEEAFDYLADFSRTAEWDPSVEDSRFRVTVSFLGRRIPLEYRITEFERPSRLVLTGGDSSLRSIDEITFVSRLGGTRVTYEARLELVGIRRLADPVLDLLFQRIGRLAVRGLRERLMDVSSQESRRRGSSKPAHQSTARSRKRAKTVRKVQSDKQKQGVA